MAICLIGSALRTIASLVQKRLIKRLHLRNECELGRTLVLARADHTGSTPRRIMTKGLKPEQF